MDLYTDTSYQLAEQLTKHYSTSFSMASRLFDISIRRYIYAIYGLVRIADEIVDTYRGNEANTQLDLLRAETSRALEVGYSTNPIVHAFAQVAGQFGINETLTEPFFESMAMDVTKRTYTRDEYRRYIYGSAEVVGLMCLRVFVGGDQAQYETLTPGARALGSAYQKVNFLRDIHADYAELGRSYFPDIDLAKFSEDDKQKIVKEIEAEFALAKKSSDGLPRAARRAVRASMYYYAALLEKLKHTPAEQIAKVRIRIPDWRKLVLLARAGVGL